jgi:2-polyprenyl-6-methoxyphenol hydroxylase-like FAD-dependent oxidoreductase
MMAGYLLARMGVDVVVLEKHKDFLRDFRGDTIHPSTLELMHELGLLEKFLKSPHQETQTLGGQVGDETFTIADFSHLPTKCKFVAFMPQWDFLNFITEQAKQYAGFHLMMQAEAAGMIEENGRIAGINVRTPEKPLQIRAALTIGADGRHSTVRARAGLRVKNLGAPMDVLWMRISRRNDDPARTLGHVEAGKMLVMIDRSEYWQCAFLIPKGTIEKFKQLGIENFREQIAQLAPFLRDRLPELKSWEDISVLTVVVDRLERWSRPGVLCIGDAAHAMSPVGGVGINLAIQDAVATANILGKKLLTGTLSLEDPQAVQRRRELPARITQRVQILIQNGVIRKVLGAQNQLQVPLALKLVQRWPFLRRIPGRLIGMGFRPEHIQTPDVHAERKAQTA